MNFTNITTVSSILINVSYENFNNKSLQYNDTSEEPNVTNNNKSQGIADMLRLIAIPLIIIFETIGNMLSSAVADTVKFTLLYLLFMFI